MGSEPRAWERELSFALDLAFCAGKIALEHFQTEVAIEAKEDGSPVTLADRRAEQTLRTLIHAEYPADAILGEEFGEEPGTSGRRWILDPIDGTKSFIHGVPLFGVLIGLEDQGQAVLGVVYLPALEEMVFATQGHGCWWRPAGQAANGGAEKRAHVSSVSPLAESLLLTTGYEYFAKAGKAGVYERCVKAVKMSRGWGDCYGQVLAATGRAEAVIEPVMHVWDCAPFLPIFSEAGGHFTDWKGNPTIAGGNSVSTNGKTHDEVLRLIHPLV
jgi:histidinol phosphatase-like enzyme (inositol monophosphatase family)